MSQSPSRPKAKQSVENTGFSPNSNAEGERLTNKDGTINLRKLGVPFYERFSMFHTLLRMSSPIFILLVFGFYTTLNLIFATIYFSLGAGSLSGGATVGNPVEQFQQAFFFSSQTLTTVGYGHISPSGFVSNVVAAIESFIGIMSFALVTGIFYARFSRPEAFIRFSHNFLVAPYRGGRGLMFRLATFKNNHLTDAEAQITGAVRVEENGKVVTKFFPLTLEINRINSLALSWTIVHPLDAKSPFVDYTEQDFYQNKIELMVTIKAFDDHFSNTVQQRSSYNRDEMIYGAKYVPMYERAENGHYTELRLNKINEYESVELEL
jgi:inward rectifier potassium channel